MRYDINFEALIHVDKYLPDFQNLEYGLVDIQVQAYQFLQWKKAGLLLKEIDEFEERKWVRITYTEAAWLKLLQIIKSYELPNKAILALKKILTINVIEEIESVDLNDDEASNIQSIVEKYDTEITLKDVLTMLKSDQVVNKAPFNSLFNFLLIDEIVNNSKVMFYLYKIEDEWEVLFVNDTVLELNKDDIDTCQFIEKIKQETHFAFSLCDCIDELSRAFITNSPKSISKNSVLSKDEKVLIENIRSGDYKEILIKRKKGSDDLSIEIKEDGMIENQDLKKISSILARKDYKKISLTKRNEKQSYVEIIR
jgi:hypothetical protein